MAKNPIDDFYISASVADNGELLIQLAGVMNDPSAIVQPTKTILKRLCVRGAFLLPKIINNITPNEFNSIGRTTFCRFQFNNVAPISQSLINKSFCENEISK